MALTFITTNTGKFAEIQLILPEITQNLTDLIEIQEIDPEKIIRAKVAQACEHFSGEFIVEDTSLSLESMNGLPGPLIKWFVKTLGPQGIWTMAQAFDTTHATAKTIIAYAKTKDDLHFFAGEVRGEIVAPRGEKGFGWDSIFQPSGKSQTFAEMTREEKNTISMRRIAAEHLKIFLDS